VPVSDSTSHLLLSNLSSWAHGILPHLRGCGGEQDRWGFSDSPATVELCEELRAGHYRTIPRNALRFPEGFWSARVSGHYSCIFLMFRCWVLVRVSIFVAYIKGEGRTIDPGELNGRERGTGNGGRVRGRGREREEERERKRERHQKSSSHNNVAEEGPSH
jgi:hypothetical protein